MAGFLLSLVHFTLIHQLVELRTSGGKSISAVASRMTKGEITGRAGSKPALTERYIILRNQPVDTGFRRYGDSR